MLYSWYLKTALLGFLFGTGWFYFFPLFTFFEALITLIISIAFLLIISKKSKWRLIMVFFVFVVLSSLRVSFDLHQTSSKNVDFYNDTEFEVLLEGFICEEPDLRPDKAKYTACIYSIVFDEKQYSLEGKVLITINQQPQYEYGDKIQARGKLKTPVEFEDFSYRDYLSRYQIFSVMYYPEINLIDKNTGSLFFQKLFQYKLELGLRINRIFPEPTSSFLAGLLIGSRRSIPVNVMDDFNTTGLTHIIAISGYNITIVIVFVMGLLSFLPRKIGFYTAIGSIVIFTFFVGASAAVVRAAIMGILGLLALHKGRETDTLLLILLTATFMIGYNPKILWYDVGFQLSFLAVLGLVYVAPLFDKWFQLVPKTLGLREALQMTLSAQITAVPIILLNFERLSLVAPLANVLVAPFIPLAMFFGFLAIVVSMISFQLSLLVGFLAYICLTAMLKTAELLANIPLASLEIQGLSYLVVVSYYLVVVLIIYFYNRKKLPLTFIRFKT